MERWKNLERFASPPKERIERQRFVLNHGVSLIGSGWMLHLASAEQHHRSWSTAAVAP